MRIVIMNAKIHTADSAAELRSSLQSHGIKEALWTGFQWSCKGGSHIRTIENEAGEFELLIESQGTGYQWSLTRLNEVSADSDDSEVSADSDDSEVSADKNCGMPQKLSPLNLLESLESSTRLGVDWLRDGLTVSQANAIDLDELTDHLEPLANGLCKAAVSRTGLAFESGFLSLRDHLKRAFPGYSFSVRFSDKGAKTTTKAYLGMPSVSESRDGYTNSQGEVQTYWSSVAWKPARAKKSDVTDPTLTVTESVGEKGNDVVLDDGSPISNQTDGEIRVDVAYTPEAVASAVREQTKPIQSELNAKSLALIDSKKLIEQLQAENIRLKLELANAKRQTKPTPKRATKRTAAEKPAAKPAVAAK